ncbi:DUF6069 family protein [Actinoplanes auranticolor]|uniref:Uncharacterized protein n=1 Tax=Actinoplanes auranticolor TaxID=47988 RepID=A0A919SN34_9ACTN|nr:DUF6069 family protein [Actinoplanes auranticolor]GIM74462.1 hypothetical protein Aau02nite_61090 [Actinoplanes auranticolor]
MNSTVSTGNASRTGAGTVKTRALTVAAAVVAAVLLWIIAVPIAGTDLLTETAADNPPAEVPLAGVIISPLVIGLVGWGLLALLERFTPKGRLIWTIIAVVVLLVSFGGPATATTTGAMLWLSAMHVVVGGILIAGFTRR